MHFYYDYIATFYSFVFLSRVYHSCALQSVRNAVAWCSVRIDLIPRGCSHICDKALALYNMCWLVATASELDLPSLRSLSVAARGRLKLGVAYWVIIQ